MDGRRSTGGVLHFKKLSVVEENIWAAIGCNFSQWQIGQKSQPCIQPSHGVRLSLKYNVSGLILNRTVFQRQQIAKPFLAYLAPT